jgi:hypothetical protein
MTFVPPVRQLPGPLDILADDRSPLPRLNPTPFTPPDRGALLLESIVCSPSEGDVPLLPPLPLPLLLLLRPALLPITALHRALALHHSAPCV